MKCQIRCLMYFETLWRAGREGPGRQCRRNTRRSWRSLTRSTRYSTNTASGWKTSRMSRVDLTALRLAVYEMKFDEDVPVGVAINEAVELAKMFRRRTIPVPLSTESLARSPAVRRTPVKHRRDAVRPIRPRSSSVHPRKMHRNPKQRQSQKKTLIIN